MDSRVSSAVVSMVIATLMAGCSPVASNDVEDLKAIYLNNFALRWDVERAVDRVARVCMEERGYDVHPDGAPVPEQSAEELVMRTFVWTSPDPATVHVDGYGDRLVAGTNTVIDFDGNVGGADLSDYERLPTSDRDAYQADLYGPDMATESAVLSDGTEVEWMVDGCVGDANRVLFPDGVFDFLEQRTHATGGADDGWLDDHRVREVHGRWSECMAQRGYLDFDIPWDAVTAMSARQPSPGEGPEAQAAFAELNVAQAVADLACHERYDVQPVQEKVFWEYTMDYLTDYEVAVVAFADTAESVLETAQRIIRAGRLPI